MPRVSLLVDRTANPLALDVLLMRQFGEQYRSWEPATLWREVAELGQVSAPNKTKIQAIRTVFGSQAPIVNIAAFQFVAWGLVGVASDQTTLDPLSPEALCFAVLIFNTVNGEDTKFHPDVQKYMAACLLEAGFSAPPRMLSFLDDEFEMAVGQDVVAAALLAANNPPPGSRFEIQAEKNRACTEFVASAAALLSEQLRD